MTMRATLAAAVTVVLVLLAACAQLAHRASQPLFFRIVAGSAVQGPVSGRLLIFIARGAGPSRSPSMSSTPAHVGGCP